MNENVTLVELCYQCEIYKVPGEILPQCHLVNSNVRINWSEIEPLTSVGEPGE
jgi:hypothetical protein